MPDLMPDTLYYTTETKPKVSQQLNVVRINEPMLLATQILSENPQQLKEIPLLFHWQLLVYYKILYSFRLFCTILTVLYHNVLYSAVLHRTVQN